MPSENFARDFVRYTTSSTCATQHTHHKRAVVFHKRYFWLQHPLGCLETGSGLAGDGVVGHSMQLWCGLGDHLTALALLGSLANAAVVQGQLKAVVLPSKTSDSSDLSLQAPSLRFLLRAGKRVPLTQDRQLSCPAGVAKMGCGCYQSFTAPPQHG